MIKASVKMRLWAAALTVVVGPYSAGIEFAPAAWRLMAAPLGDDGFFIAFGPFYAFAASADA